MSLSITADFAEITGCWQNTASDTLWLSALDIFEQDGQLLLRPIAVNKQGESEVWGEFPLQIFEFHGTELALRCQFYYQDIAVDMTAYSNKGLIVAATHLSFAKDDSLNHLSREFFVRLPQPAKVYPFKPNNHETGCQLLVDNWLNCDPEPKIFTRIEIFVDESGQFIAKVWGTDDYGYIGKARLNVHLGCRKQSGFTATLPYQKINETKVLEQGEVHLIANYKLGVLVIEPFFTVSSSYETTSYIAREFFARQQLVATSFSTEVDLPAIDDVLPQFVGRWRNGDLSHAWLKHFELFQADNKYCLSVSVAEDYGQDLAPVEVERFMDNMGYIAFKASFELGSVQIEMAANTQTALVVMTSYVRVEHDKLKTYREIFVAC